jgi:hypothetical protein
MITDFLICELNLILNLFNEDCRQPLAMSEYIWFKYSCCIIDPVLNMLLFSLQEESIQEK